MIFAIYTLLLCLLTTQAFYCANAFVSPRAFHSRINVGDAFHKKSPHELNMLPENYFAQLSSTVLSDEAAEFAIARAADSSLQGVRTFFAVSSGLVFAAIGLYFVTAAIIVPKAAQQLEKDTKRLQPGLWEEFEEKAKLEEGETLAARPELLQELGTIMQPIIMADFETSAESKGKPPLRSKDAKKKKEKKKKKKENKKKKSKETETLDESEP
jgi:hypothetical protein